MKTVQEWLDNVDEKRLSGAYFTGFPIYYKMIADKGLTLEEIRVKSKNRFSDFIHSIKQIEMKISDTSWVFFACNRYQSGYSNVDVEMCRVDDIRKSGHPQCYSWLLIDFAEIMAIAF